MYFPRAIAIMAQLCGLFASCDLATNVGPSTALFPGGLSAVLSERGVAEEIGEYVRRENQMGHLGGFQQLRCVEAFLKYLKYQQAQLQFAYHEFGGDRSGASFVIKQIENAFGYFRNPTIGPAQRNLLDE